MSDVKKNGSSSKSGVVNASGTEDTKSRNVFEGGSVASKTSAPKETASNDGVSSSVGKRDKMTNTEHMSDVKDKDVGVNVKTQAAVARAKKSEVKIAEPQSTEPKAIEPKTIESKIDALNRAYATGRRKESVSRVWVKLGKGNVIVNGKKCEQYFVRPVLRMFINQPFERVNRSGQFDVFCTVKGGGLSGQAGAIQHGVSRALVNFEPKLRGSLKENGFLTRDARKVERKKYGRAKARRSYQFSKR